MAMPDNNERRVAPPSAATHALVRRVPPREIPDPPETWPIIEHEPEREPVVPPDLHSDELFAKDEQ